MKKFLILLFSLFVFTLPTFADTNNPDMELPSESGFVENVQYEDTPSLQQGDNSVKQIVKVKVFTGK